MLIIIPRATLLLFLFCILELPLLSLCGEAQVVSTKQVEAKLAVKVHLLPKSGRMTLTQVLQSLSKQTGLEIEAVEELSKRELILSLDSLSVRDTLDAIAELNDWHWSESRDNHILVTRRTVHLPPTAGAIPRQVQASLPADWRAFLGVPVPDENFNHYVSMIPSNHAAIQARGQNEQQLNKAASDERAALFDMLTPLLTDTTVFPVSRLSHDIQMRLIRFYFLQALSQTSFELLHGDPLPYVLNPSSAILKLSGGTTLLIGSKVTNNGVETEIGFGAAITKTSSK